jgi:hypothetical protein
VRRGAAVGLQAILIALSVAASTSRAQPTIARDPYAEVDWATDVRLKAQFHDHTYASEQRIQAYDAAGYDVVSMFDYSGNYTVPYAWTERRWPPEAWMDPGFLASLVNIDFLIPSAEEVAYGHLTSPFLTEFIDRWDPATYPEPQPWHYFSTQQGIDLIAELGGMPVLAHPWGAPELWDDLERYHALEVYNAHGPAAFRLGNVTYDLSSDLAPFWDLELSEARHVFAVAVNDHWGPWNTGLGIGLDVRDSGKTIVISHDTTPAEFRDAFERGAMFAVKDLGLFKDQYPVVSAILADASSITIFTADSVTWIADGEIVGSGTLLPLAWLPESAHYVRAEISNSDGSIVFTQPFFFRQLCGDVTDDGLVDELDAQAFRGWLADPAESPLPPAGARKCNVSDTPDGCDLLDATLLRRSVEVPSLAPGIAETCEAASP